MRNVCLTLLAGLSFTTLAVFSQQHNLNIIPAPKSVSIREGTFVLSRQSAIQFIREEDRKIALLFRDFLKHNYFLDLPVAKSFVKVPKGVVAFSSSGYSGSNPEGYSLIIDKVKITASGKGAGLFYAFQTLMQLFPVEKEAAPKIACARIIDEPRYRYRGLHLDVGRHFFPIPFIKKYIDFIAQYKLNTFHWHLTEDQGWRIEIKKYPKLMQVAAFRNQTLIGNLGDRDPNWFDGTRYGGYYTQEDVKEIVAYAGTKFVTVIPEIELPGHSSAALAAYPELGCGDNPGPFKVVEKWGVFEDVYCAGKENTFQFLEDVLSEVVTLFPSTYIHIGGDESPKTRWKECKFCQKRIKENNLKDEHELQSYFVSRIEKFLNSKGRQIIGWDEILEGGLAPNATVMSWRGVEGGTAAAKQNHNAIMTPSPFVYFDYAEGDPSQEPLNIGGHTPLWKTYSYDPTPPNLTPAEQGRIIGVQANVWTEYIPTPAKVEYMLFPRLYALSEIAWTDLNQKNFTNFSEKRVPVHLAKLDKTKTLYRVPTTIGVKDTTLIGNEFTFTLKSPVIGAKIYYNITTYTPGETDKYYEVPFKISVPKGEQRVLKTMVITPSGKRSAVTTTILSNPVPLSPVNKSGIKQGIRYKFVPGEFMSVKQIDTAKATERSVLVGGSFETQKFNSKSKLFGLVLEGYVNIDQDGLYTFTSSSDDGSTLIIDDRLVVDNDGRHSTFDKTGLISLLKGFHKIQIRYFQIDDGELKIYISGPNRAKTELQPSALFN